MANYLCVTCGTQFAETETPPEKCAICADVRQYVPPAGQRWTTLEELRAQHRNLWEQFEPDLFGIGTSPEFAIGQRALFLRTPEGNFLWDCIALLDRATIDLLYSLGGIKAIAISHPHFYTSLVEWSRAFDVPVHLHAADRQWIMRPDSAIQLWEGETLPLLPDLTVIRGGGHFPGGSMLHWAKGAGGRGVLCSSDIATVATDRKILTFMYSYPNFIPLSAQQVNGIAAALAPFQFDTIYGHYFDRVIPTGGKEILKKSVARYIAAIGGSP